MFALPGMKIGWMALSGSPERTAEAARALELISDTFLPVNETAQFAVPDVFRLGESFRTFYSGQIVERWKLAEPILRRCPRLQFHGPQGGFYVTAALRDVDEETAAEKLLRHSGLLVHPGHFYDVRPDHLVLSFVQDPAVIRKAFPSLTAALASI
jgi:aspartate/methionine/tyrosine aminotransferase